MMKLLSKLPTGILLSAVFVSSSFGQDSTGSNESQSYVRITLPSVTVEDGRLFDTVAASMDPVGREVAGFNLTFGVQGSFIEIVDVLPGEMIDSCQWEYFHASKISDSATLAGGLQLWKVTALAKTSPDTSGLTCLVLDREAGIVNIVVSNLHQTELIDTTIALQFWWQSCRDNVVSDLLGNSLMMSRQIYSAGQTSITDTLAKFPTLKGAPNTCIDLRRKNHPVRGVDYTNGEIIFQLKVNTDE